jgi:hypothetical protein
LNVKNKLLVTHLSALSELALSAPNAFETKGDIINDFVMKKVVEAVSPSANVRSSCEMLDIADERSRMMMPMTTGSKRVNWKCLIELN